MVERDYSVLRRSGEPSDGQLVDAWIKLVSEYHLVTRSKEARKHVEATSKIEMLNLKIFQIEKLLEAIAVHPASELTDCLKEWGYDYEYSPESIEQDLDRVKVSLANDKTKLAIARNNYHSGEGGAGAVATKESYLQMLMSISKFRNANPPYRPTQINTYEFCLMYNELTDHNNILKSQNKRK